MKTKIALIAGIVLAVLLIAYSVIQGGRDHEAKRAYWNEVERMQTLGYRVIETNELKPYAKTTRAAGKITGILCAGLLVVSALSLAHFKKRKGLFITHIIAALFTLIGSVFSLVLTKSTGAVSFDETFILWVLLGVIAMVVYIVSLIKTSGSRAAAENTYQNSPAI